MRRSEHRCVCLLQELGFSGQALISKKLNDYRKQRSVACWQVHYMTKLLPSNSLEQTRLSVSPCSPTGSKPDSSPRLPRMKPPFLLAKAENSAGAPRSPKPEGKGQCPGNAEHARRTTLTQLNAKAKGRLFKSPRSIEICPFSVSSICFKMKAVHRSLRGESTS